MQTKTDNTWAWLAPLYFMEGLPNVVVSVAAVVFYSEMGLDVATVAMLTSMLYLPWVLKPFWSPIVDAISTKRKWILAALFAFIIAFFALALAPLTGSWVLLSCAAFWILGISSATFDIAGDGFYMLALDKTRQAFFVGIRNSFYRIAVVVGQGGLIWLAGALVVRFGFLKNQAWSACFFACALVCALSLVVLRRALPKPISDCERKIKSFSALYDDFKACFVGFFARKGIFTILAYILFYRFSEAQLAKIVPLFLKADKCDGGLGFSLETFGKIQMFSPLALFAGGILGGIFIAKKGLAKTLLTMALFMNLPNVIYVLLAYYLPSNSVLVCAGICVEQFGYGFGFAGYMMYLISVSKGEFKTAFYAICTGIMALGLVLPGAVSGAILAQVGYLNFFIWALCATIISFAVTIIAKINLGRV